MVQSYMQPSLETRLGIPLIYGSDAVHGHSNVVGATIFPHNVGLGATRDANLVERVGYATAKEILATNVHWNFAPAVSVPRDIRWGRSYEGFSENTAVVSELGAAYVRGLQTAIGDDRALGSVKHFVADGGTEWDSRAEMPYTVANNWQAASENWRIDQGDARIDEETLCTVHLAPYKDAIEAGAENIMVSFSSWNGLKMHANTYLLTDVLKGEWGFEGFLVSDWMAVNQLTDDFYAAVVQSINAGLDMVMVPFDYKGFISTLTKAIQKGDISIERIDDAVSRILRAKFMWGLFEHPLTADSLLETVRSEAHIAIAEEAVQKSLVLLKNENDALPLNTAQSLYVAGTAADDIGLACGGWTIEWQGGRGAITDGTTLLDGLKAIYGDDVQYDADANFADKADVGVVVVAEEPYAEGEGDRDDLTLSEADSQLISKMREHCEQLILIVYSGRPIIISHVSDMCDAIVAAWLPGSEAQAIAPVLTGDVSFTGKLPFTWIASMEQLPQATLPASETPQWAFGHGL
ncbi:MAG: glycoside hydrolase family 3 protein, partial [Chloroflexota bacterium]